MRVPSTENVFFLNGCLLLNVPIYQPYTITYIKEKTQTVHRFTYTQPYIIPFCKDSRHLTRRGQICLCLGGHLTQCRPLIGPDGQCSLLIGCQLVPNLPHLIVPYLYCRPMDAACDVIRCRPLVEVWSRGRRMRAGRRGGFLSGKKDIIQ